nr:hypothetical protein [Tanacetum cinerariifolium]
MTTSFGNNSVFRSFFEKQKFTGPNFIDWYIKLRLVLSTEDKENYLEHPILAAPLGHQVPPEALAAHAVWVKGQKEVVVLMLLTMDLEILRNLAHLGAYDKLQELKSLYSTQAEQELLQTVREFHTYKQEEDYGTHICITTQGLRGSKKLKPGALSLKIVRKPYSHQVERAKDLHRLIHTDVCGPFKIMSRQGASYFVTFTDDFCRYGYDYLLKHKHEVFETFKIFQKEVENQLGKTIKSLRSDHKGEYMSQEFLDHLKEHGIIAHRTPPHAPQNNKVSDRRNRTLLDMVRSMMSQTTLPKYFWDYAFETAARILNMIPTKKGCEVFVKRDTLTKHDKLDPRSFKCIFVGYPKETMRYSFYSPSENKVFVAQNAEFFESKFLDLKASGSVEDLELIQKEDTNPSVDTSLNHKEDDQEIDESQSDINPICKSSWTRRGPDRMCLYIDTGEHELGDLGEPANYKSALLDPKSKKWLDAMNVEMQSMKDNDVWVLVKLPPNARTVGSKWIFKKKTDMDGGVYIFKARLVAKGFTQTYGVLRKSEEV